MREWSLKSGDPLSLVLASDARLGSPDYCDDQIWELKLGDGDPPAIAVETTYGLHARMMRMFPGLRGKMAYPTQNVSPANPLFINSSQIISFIHFHLFLL